MLKKFDVVNHSVFGKGTIIDIEDRGNLPRILYIQFDNEPKTIRRFTDASIAPFIVK